MVEKVVVLVLTGAFINLIAIVGGALIGSRLVGMRKDISNTVMQAIGLVVLVIGFSMALKTDDLILILISLVLGGIIGSGFRLEERLERWGKWVEGRFGGTSRFATGFVTGTLVYCVGPMAVLGGLDSGLRGDHQILITKSLLDGFTAVIFSSTLGIGVLFASIPVFLYQGSIALSAGWITGFLNDALLDQVITQVTATGGILIVGIGINLLGIGRIRVADLLPALPVAVLATVIQMKWM